tara:strand:+ start:312 stop:776 length:465 start_codon:yes stop_codon:yes gene_type:complete
MNSLSADEKQALAAFYEQGSQNDQRILRWIWLRFSAAVFLLSLRGLMAILLPDQMAHLFTTSEAYLDAVLYRLWLFLPLTLLYAATFWLRTYLREASLAAAVILSALLWTDIELHLMQYGNLSGLWSMQTALRSTCIVLAVMNFIAAAKLEHTR